MPTLTPSARKELGIRWGRILCALWAMAVALPWLLPTRAPPWASFYQEAATAAVFLSLCLWALSARPCPPALASWSVDGAVLVFGLLPAVPLLQAAAGLFAVPAESLLVALYLAAIAAVVAASQQAERLSPARLTDALFAGLAIAASVSAGLALLQWLQLTEVSQLIAPSIAGGRPTANVGQPNNLSTLLAWGVVALWWLHLRKRLSSSWAWSLAGWLLLGIALTQSRTGWLQVALVGGAVMVGQHKFGGTRRQGLALALLGLGFVITVLALGLPPSESAPTAALSLGQQVAAGKRPDIWQMALAGIAQRPWLGWGWNQNVLAHVALAQHFPTLFVTIGHAHNILLDLLLWNGVPLGALIILAAGAWLRQQLRGPLSPERGLLLLALAVFGLHAMLELPHAYSYFLLPAAAMVGTLMALRPLPVLATLPRLLPLAAVTTLGMLLAAVVVDYRRIESDVLSQRLREVRVGTLTPPPVPTVHVLSGLQTAQLTMRTEPLSGLSSEQLERWRRTVMRYPAPGGLVRYAHAAALNGHPGEAEWALALVCQLHAASICHAVVREWMAESTARPLLMERVRLAATTMPLVPQASGMSSPTTAPANATSSAAR